MNLSRVLVTAAAMTGLLGASAVLAETGHQHGHGAGNGKATGPQVVDIAVTGDGFVAAPVKVKAGRPVRLVVTRKTERTCATDIVLKEYGIKKALPLNQAVEVTFTPAKAGLVRYACAMDMIAGTLNVE